MAIDLETLLAPVSDEDPAGPDLAYDPQRHRIEQAFDTSVSIDASGIVEQRGDTDWRQVMDTIATLATRTKDLWLGVYFCRAAAESGRLDQVELGVAFVAGLLDRYWEAVHPRLDEYGVEARKSAFDALASAPAFTGPLRRIVYADHARLGRITGEDIARFHRGGDGEEGYGMFRAMLAEAEIRAALTEGAAAIERIEATIHAIDERLMANAGARNATDFSALYDALATQKIALRSFVPAPLDAEIDMLSEDAVAGADGAPGGVQPVGGTVRNREDVARVLDLVLDYYRRHEPSSPVPMLVERARGWIGLDFMAVLEDIAPSALVDAQAILRMRGQ
ncbi:type VI secretion system protein TssA [Sphingomonas trueperi]|uniref:type VI secretion system protein TssA n=1 Tax=Sphingomonas trueperi TaxID=53317 RepID=UPI000EAB9B2F